MQAALQEALHLLEAGALLGVLVLIVAAVQWVFAKAKAAAANVQNDAVRQAIEAAIFWAEAQAEVQGKQKLRLAVAKAEELLGCTVDEAQVEAILARLKADGLIG